MYSMCLNQVKQAMLDHQIYTWLRTGKETLDIYCKSFYNGQDVSRKKIRHLENLSGRSHELYLMETGVCISFSIKSLVPLFLVKTIN